MEIVEVPISELKPSEYNPRQMTEKQVEDLTNSIKEFGLVDPIIVNRHPGRENVVVGGHQRLKIASVLGFQTVPVVYVDLDEKRERELNLRLNKNLGEWDWNMLANFDKEELLNVGFRSEELDKIFNVKEDEFDADKEYEKIEEPKTKLGDLYKLGEHRLLCGDSTKKESFERLMGGEKAQMVFTDPPYNVNYKYDWRRALHKGKKVKNTITSFRDKWTPEDYKKLIYDVFKNCFDFSFDSATFYCWHATKTEQEVRSGIEEAGWHFSQTLIWLKENIILALGQDYQRIYEPCYFGWKKGKKRFVNRVFTNKFRDAFSLNYEDFTDWLDVVYQKRDKLSDYIHSTQKPVRLAERALKKHSERGSIILEPFNGSGSTMIACEQLNRKCYAIELDPKFVDVAIKRWEQFTGQKAIKL